MSRDVNNEYFSDGITEEIINALTKVKGLKVTARTSSFAFKNQHVDIRKIGAILNVSNILEGSIKVYKNTIRINVQLVRVSDGFHIWSKKFQRNLENIFELQDEISLIIAQQIRENFGHFNISETISSVGTKNIKAYKLFLKGRHYQLNWLLEDYLKAIDFYKQSLIEDPNFSDAYFALSRSYSILTSWGYIKRKNGLKSALNYLEKGLKLNASSYLGFFSKASVCFWNNWEYEKGIHNLKQTIALNPNFAIAFEALSEIYMATNQLDKALTYIDKALEINPLSPNHHFTKGNIYFLKKEYQESIIHLNESLLIEQNFGLALETKLACYLLLNDEKQFKQFINETPHLENPSTCELLFDFLNKEKVTLNHIKIDIENSFKSLYPWNFYLLIHSGATDKAFSVFQDKIQLRLGQLVNYKLDPLLQPIRLHKDYQSLDEQIVLNSEEKYVTVNAQIAENNIKPLTEQEISNYKETLISTLNDEKLYLNPNLSLKVLGEHINLHSNKLSWLLNAEFNRNFNDFINHYRLTYFKTIALDPKFNHITILGLAYDSGFNSKSAFNTYFKKAEGITPSKWVQLHSE
ncbi:helix-turn-helix domain-containing protein [Xanthomarina sp. F2636L]|uniref:helix-turn-helix domain-containing protein n=1 Tax=Xanthomarina sp. F2636L TaxID=2996018 RepID=UPI00225DF71E|nr:helix-turn-helix domain-containing protein [Xanthomarina sp. F2636L]MCX7549645.1 helix-turn-helix domain-containing protein [Xanthomarina sp. F2636L]